VLGVVDANRDLKQPVIFFMTVKHWWY